MLQSLLIAHLLLVTLQLPLRALVFDTTYYRDILLFASLGLWGLVKLKDMLVYREKLRPNLLDWLFALYVLYGMLMILLALGNGISLLEAVTQFRNYFLPAALFFVAKKSFASSDAQARLVNLFSVIALIFILDVVIEFVALRAGLSVFSIPWYRFMFRANYRFIGNEVGSPGYVLPSYSPLLGLLGWPHYTVVTLMALFAFSYPFLAEKRLKDILGDFSGLSVRLPTWIRRGVGPLAIVAVLVLNVRTHLVSALVVLMVLPFLTQPKLLVRNLGILSLAALSLWAVDSLRSRFILSVLEGFVGTGSSPAVLERLFTRSELAYIANSPLPRLFIGSTSVARGGFLEAGAFEVRLLFFTAAYGLVWLFLYLGIYAVGFLLARKILLSRSTQPLPRLFALGTIGLLTVYLLDMGHYARAMYWPNIDIWAVCLGTLSAIAAQQARGARSSSADAFARPKSRTPFVAFMGKGDEGVAPRLKGGP